LRIDDIQQTLSEVSPDVAKVWIATARANSGRVPAGLVSDAALAMDIERAISLPWHLIPTVLRQKSPRLTRSKEAEEVSELGKVIAPKE